MQDAGQRKFLSVVLIETLWNVKFSERSNILPVSLQVLIETLWNVKIKSAIIKMISSVY